MTPRAAERRKANRLLPRRRGDLHERRAHPALPPPVVSQQPNAVRRFQSPSGRVWTASLFEVPPLPDAPAGAPASVLRFESGDVILDLDHWPPDWSLRSDLELIELARQASTPDFRPWSLRTPARSRPRYGT